MRIYLDNCCFNRPFDSQRQTRVRIEAEAKLRIQEQIRGGTFELVWSYILDFENAATPFDERRRTIANWRQYAAIDVDESEDVLEWAGAFAKSGLRAKDALHLACAIASECTYFITTDDDILKRRDKVEAVAILEPAAFVREMNL